MLDEAVDQALQRLRAGQEDTRDRRAGLERELALVEAQLRNLTAAVKRGKATDTLLDVLQSEEDRKKILTAQLAQLGEVATVASLDRQRLKQALHTRVADVKGLLGDHTPKARQGLRKLLADRLELEPVDVAGQPGVRFTGKGTFGKILTGEASPLMVVPPG
jgi:hypothetical protein